MGYPESDGRCGKKMVLQRQYTPDCLQKRNKYMVDHADIVLTVWIIRPDTLEVQYEKPLCDGRGASAF